MKFLKLSGKSNEQQSKWLTFSDFLAFHINILKNWMEIQKARKTFNQKLFCDNFIGECLYIYYNEAKFGG